MYCILIIVYILAYVNEAGDPHALLYLLDDFHGLFFKEMNFSPTLQQTIHEGIFLFCCCILLYSFNTNIL